MGRKTLGGAIIWCASSRDASVRCDRDAADGLLSWGDDPLVAVFSRAPFASHGAVRATCRRLRAVLDSRAFRAERRASGHLEHGLCVVGGYRAGVGRRADCAVLAGGRWRAVPRQLRQPRSFVGGCALGGETWITGGSYAGGVELRTAEIFDHRASEWRLAPHAMAEARCAHVAAAFGGALIVAGGARDGEELKSAEILRSPLLMPGARGSGWSALPPLARAASRAACAVLGGRLYLIGGLACDALQVWDGARWSVRASLPDARWDAAAVAHGGRVVVIGGVLSNRVGTASVIEYDPLADSWADAGALPEPRVSCQAAAFEGGIVVVGDGAPLRSAAGGGWVPFRALGSLEERSNVALVPLVLG